MAEQWPDEQKMTSYLLGTLSEAEAERMDELSLTDDQFVDRLGAVENDLVDAYVRGELAGEARQRFDSHYLASPRRREKVRLARTFLRIASTAAMAATQDRPLSAPPVLEPKKKPPASSPWLTLFTAPRPAWRWGLAAAALLGLLAGGYLLLENARLRNQMAQTQVERAALQQREQELQKQLEAQQATDAAASEALAQVRERLAQLEEQLAAQPRNEKPGPGGRDLRVVAFTLAPPMRSANEIVNIAVPVGTDIVALQLQLEVNDFPAYRAVLKNPAKNQIIWRSRILNAGGQGKAVVVRLRAGLLKSQNYTIELSGLRPGGASELIGSYTFKIATP